MRRYLRHLGPLLGSAVGRALSKPTAKPAGYIGWVGHKNLGDEALYMAIRALVRPLLLRVFSPVQEAILNPLSLSGKRHFQGVLLGGGTIIGPAYALPVRRTLKLRLPMVTFGSGVGSAGFGNAERPELSEWKNLLDQFEMIGVRGWRSHEALTKLGIKKVQVIGDPALSLGPDTLPKAKVRPTLAVNLAGNAGDQYGIGTCACYREVAAIAKRHIADGGDLLPIALGPGDRRFLRDLLADAGLEGQPILQPHTPDQFLRCVSGAQWLIGVRLHSAVLASAVGTVPILFAYRDKCRDFMESIDLADLTVEWHAEAGLLLRAAFELARSRPELRDVMFVKVQQWKAEQRTYARQIAASFSAGNR